MGFLTAQPIGDVDPRPAGDSAFFGAHQVQHFNLAAVQHFQIHPMFRAYLGIEEAASGADGSDNDPPGVDAARFDGLLEHVEKHLGATYAFDPPEGRGYGITMHRLEDEMVSAVTTGLRFQDLAARPPVEFVCSLRQDQEREAHHLAGLAAGWVELLESYDKERLWEHWRDEKTPIWDIHRTG